MNKAITITAFAFMFALLILSIGLNIRQEFKSVDKERQLTSLLSNTAANKVVKEYTRDSIKHTVFNEKIIHNNSSEKIAALDKSYADSLQQALKISIDKIDQVTKINGRLEAQLQLLNKQNEKGQILKVHKDKYLDLAYNTETDSIQISYDIHLNDARYHDKKWLLGKTNNYIDLYSDDKRVTINGVKSFRIKESTPKRFGLGFNAGYGLIKDGLAIKALPYMGVGINYNLLEF